MMMNNNIPKKGDIIINPNTQRPVRVGGRTWLGLVKKGLIEGRYTDPKELGKIPEENEDVNEELKRVNSTLPRGQQAVRGRGRYKGKIVSRNQRPDTESITRYTAQTASRIVNDNIEELNDCDDLEAELERLILEEMASSIPKSKPKNVQARGRGRPSNKIIKTEQFELQESPQQYDEEEDEGDEEESEDVDYFEYSD
jgi:hypothetical protein